MKMPENYVLTRLALASHLLRLLSQLSVSFVSVPDISRRYVHNGLRPQFQLRTCRPFVPPSGHGSGRLSNLLGRLPFRSQPNLSDSQFAAASETAEPANTQIAGSYTPVTPVEVHTLLSPALSHELRAIIPRSVHSPIHARRLANLLQYDPDINLVAFLVSGFSFGFSLGVQGIVRSGALPNLASTRQNSEAVSAAVAVEVSRGLSHGPFSVSPFSQFHAASLGIVSKKSGSFRLILDLSVNHAGSVNGGIDIAEVSVTYCAFDDAVDLVRAAGASPFMAKLDVKHAFQLCPVRPSEWPLLCYHWKGAFYFDSRLPFGLRSSPFIFNIFADALQ